MVVVCWSSRERGSPADRVALVMPVEGMWLVRFGSGGKVGVIPNKRRCCYANFNNTNGRKRDGQRWRGRMRERARETNL